MALEALVLCLIFIAWLLVRDFRRRPPVSRATWIPTLMLLVLASRPLSSWLSGGADVTNPEMAVEGTTIDRAFYLSLVIAAWLVASLRGVKWSRFFAANATI